MVDDRRTDDGRMPDHGHPISSPCEPNGSGELKNKNLSMLCTSYCVAYSIKQTAGFLIMQLV